jgi:hypothetical protein
MVTKEGAVPADSAPRPRDAVSPRKRGLDLLFLGSIIVSFLAASAAPTPLYARYAEHWGFSPLATTFTRSRCWRACWRSAGCRITSAAVRFC